MNNKTCGECSWFSESGNRCKLHNNQYIFGDRAACKDFKQKPTNGDVIRQGGNDSLVEYRQKFICHVCAYRFDKKCNGAKCKDGLIAWLNAPADCVTENGKSAKQADLCCKSAKESEGEDE